MFDTTAAQIGRLTVLQAALKEQRARLAELEKQVAAASEAEVARSGDDLMVKERVGADDIAEVIAAWTGIPAGRLLQGETEKLLSMESIIGSRLIGQSSAVQAVSDAVRRSCTETSKGLSACAAAWTSAAASWPAAATCTVSAPPPNSDGSTTTAARMTIVTAVPSRASAAATRPPTPPGPRTATEGRGAITAANDAGR